MAKRGGFPGGGMPGNMANLMKQAQKMQDEIEDALIYPEIMGSDHCPVGLILK